MRAREFVINVPIKININGDDDPSIEMGNEDESSNPGQYTPISPLQQEIEIEKAKVGIDSPGIQQIKSASENMIGGQET
jgi:hypothetical protein|tara:strand:+ start:579 stop:815 length:237 start_codon:yes stop_codon:yes gene_type:complete